VKPSPQYRTPFWVPNWERDPEAYYQGVFVRLALEERGRKARIEMNHLDGRNRIDGVETGIVYPDRWFALTASFLTAPKPVRFSFQGYTPKGRAEMLKAFQARHPETEIHSTGSSRQRQKRTPKGALKTWQQMWDGGYYARLGAAQFGLCPHHPDWVGPWETMWTYRMIECCLVGAIPVLFRKTPLCDEFTAGIRFVWDDDATFTYSPEDAAHNRRVAEERWRLL
jgi:hypothetical protein